MNILETRDNTEVSVNFSKGKNRETTFLGSAGRLWAIIIFLLPGGNLKVYIMIQKVIRSGYILAQVIVSGLRKIISGLLWEE